MAVDTIWRARTRWGRGEKRVAVAPRCLVRSVAGLTLAAALSGCSPALDWRQLRGADGGLSLAMPCRPAVHERVLPLAGQSLRWQMAVCSVAGLTFGLGSGELADPALVPRALQALAEAARANLDGQVLQAEPAGVPGMTPQEAARHLLLEGRRADGSPSQMHVWVFAHGMRVYQASVLGTGLSDAHWRPFAEGLAIVAR